MSKYPLLSAWSDRSSRYLCFLIIFIDNLIYYRYEKIDLSSYFEVQNYTPKYFYLLKKNRFLNKKIVIS